MPLQGNLSIERMCQLVQVSRAGFYRWLQEPPAVEEEMEMRSLIQQIVISVPFTERMSVEMSSNSSN